MSSEDNSSEAAEFKDRTDTVRRHMHWVTRRVEMRERATALWFTAGLAGFVVLVSSDLGAKITDKAPYFLTSIMLSCVLGGGGAFIVARAIIQAHMNTLQDLSEEAEAQGYDAHEMVRGYPEIRDQKEYDMALQYRLERLFRPETKSYSYYFCWYTALLLTLTAALTFLLIVWWPIVSSWLGLSDV